MSATVAIQKIPPGRRRYGQGEQERARRRQDRNVRLGLLLPGLLGLGVSFVLPLLYMLRMSFNVGEPNGIVVETFTFDTYMRALGDPYYWKVTGDTFVMGLLSAAFCVLVSYPIALFLARTESKWKGVLIALAIAPLLTSAVVRTFGWMVILGNQGLVNTTLTQWGWVTQPLVLANNMTGVVIGLVEIFMPYAILTMISGFGRISTQLEEAAASLGASKAKVFARITLPLSLPGVLTAFLLVFVLAVSTFVTPRLLGGGVVQVLATEIYDQTTGLLNWPFAAALSMILLVLFGTVIGIYSAIIRKMGAAS